MISYSLILYFIMNKKLKLSRKLYKEKILQLIGNRISLEQKDQIINAITKNNINNILLTFSLATQELLAKNGVAFLKSKLPKMYNKNVKNIASKQIFDATKNSIKPIYTPMGNKR